MTVLYADLSHHDWDRCKGELDWAAIRKATSPVVCLRATYGDPAGYNPSTRHFADMALGARRAGFDTIGGYHNLVRGDAASVARQVDYLRRELDRVGATWAMLDVERYPELVSNGLWPRFDDVTRFVARWRAVDRRVLAIYLPKWIWEGHLGRPDLRPLRCPLVASDYGSNPDGGPTGVYSTRGGDTGRGWTAYGGVTPAMWQFGSNINCPGASGQTDVNAYRGTLTQLRAFLTTGSQEDLDMSLTDMQAEQLDNVERMLAKLLKGGLNPGPDGRPENAAAWWWRMLANNADPLIAQQFPAEANGNWKPIPVGLAQLGQQLAALRADVTALAGRDVVDEPAIVEGVLAGLGSRPAGDVARALVAAGQDPSALAAELTKLASTAPQS